MKAYSVAAIFIASCMILLGCKKSWSELSYATKDEKVILQTNPESAVAAGLKLAQPYRIDDICLPSMVGDGMADVAAGCKAFEKYLRAQCGNEINFIAHDNPKISEIPAIAKDRATKPTPGFWMVGAHGQDYDIANRNMIYTKDRECGKEEVVYTGDLLRAVRNSDSSAIWLSACHAELKNDVVKNVGYSSRYNQPSGNPFFADDGGPGPEYSQLFLVDALCHANAKLFDKNNDGYLNGMELGAKIYSFEQIKAIADKDRKPFPEGYSIKNETKGFVISEMTCTDRLNRQHNIGYRGQSKDVFALTKADAERNFASLKPSERREGFLWPAELEQETRLPFPGKQVYDHIRIADNFPASFSMGDTENELEVLRNCTPVIETGALLEIKFERIPLWSMQAGEAQDAVPADFMLALPVWKK